MANKTRQEDEAVGGPILYTNIMCPENWVTGVYNWYRSHSLPWPYCKIQIKKKWLRKVK